MYDGRTRQLKVPEELKKIPDLLPRYLGDIPEFTLALAAYTVNTYTPSTGARKDQVTVNLNIHFGVILHEPFLESDNEVSGNEEGEAGDD
jgi:hypothetical protein